MTMSSDRTAPGEIYPPGICGASSQTRAAGSADFPSLTGLVSGEISLSASLTEAVAEQAGAGQLLLGHAGVRPGYPSVA